MTLNGAIKQLHDLRSAEDMPSYYKPCIAEVINVLLMDTQEVRHGRWIKVEDDYNNHLYECSYCHTWTSLPTEEVNDRNIRYCWSCGAKMDEVEE